MSVTTGAVAAAARAVLVGAGLMAAAVTAAGQPSGPPGGRPPSSQPETAMVEVAPIRCWWRTSAGAVTIGQPFDVRLTCAVLETDAVQVVPDETRLTVAGVQLKPFEVLGGEHPADTRAGPRRFFQYRYKVRLIDADSIGNDVSLPNLTIIYKVQSRVAEDATLAGRDFTYVMPGLPVHVLSLVPEDGVDVRDGADVGLERIEVLRFRARLFDIGALALIAAGGLLAAFALVAAVDRTHRHEARALRRVSNRRVLAAAGAELSLVARASAGGWTPELANAAHSALRVVAAIAIGRRVSEQPLAAGQSPPDGRLPVPGWLPGRPGTAVTSATTGADVARALASLPPAAPIQQRAGLEVLQAALGAFTVARYAPGDGAPDPLALAAAVEGGQAEAARLARERLWRWPGRAEAAPPWREGASRR